MNKFYLTTAIDYVNGAPHIGHAYEKILTDVIARHFRQRCDDVYFLTGVDEHGIKIQKTASAQEIEPQELCDINTEKFKETWKLLEISYDKLIRTTDEEHKKIVKQIFKKLVENNDVYKHSYEGLYCSGCECFLNSKDLDEDGNCPDHKKKPELVSEENYFFRLTKYKDAIIKHIKENPDFIQPAFRASEVLNVLENIEDISVSRSKKNVTWGIEVDGDDEQVIYVWIDALSNYITALGYPEGENFKKYWAADVQVIGKDILKFHAIYWIALLMALKIDLPKTILAHGWITIDKDKMSKSLGNVISPQNILEAYNLTQADAFRYYMATAAPLGKDGNYSDEDFKEKVNANLANNIGNLLNRTLNMLIKYFDGEIKPEFKVNEDLKREAQKTVEKVKSAFDCYDAALASNAITELADLTNKYVNDTAPWTLAKEGKMNECGSVLLSVLEVMNYIAVLIQPFCPNIARAIASQLKTDSSVKLDEIKPLKGGKLILKEEIQPVFLRIDSEFAQNKK